MAVAQFASSDPTSEDSRDREPLGVLPEALVIHMLGADALKPNLGSRLIESYPPLSVYGQIEETYLSLSRQARHIDTVDQGK